MYFNWNNEKNELLKKQRRISFEEVVWSVEHGLLLDVIEHKSKEKYKNQKIFIIKMHNYVWMVPFVESEDEIFLKTIIPSRKATREYLDLGEKND
jgi:uncharacterized DUF497 family protein